MPAMRNKTITFVFLSVLLWATVTYFLIFYPSSIVDNQKSEFRAKLKRLEDEVSQLIISNNILLHKLRTNEIQIDEENPLKTTTILKSADKPDNTVEKYEDNPNVLQQLSNNYTDWLKNLDVNLFKTLGSNNNVNADSPVIAVLVISCNRVTVRRCIDQLIRFRPSIEQFPIIVSQDCQDQQTSEVIKSYGDKISHIQQPDQSDIEVPPREKKFKGYFKIARHYGWALNQIFFKFGFDTAIVVEDDLDVAPDFFEYFLGTHSVLTEDPSLWCVSAWNDNGKADLIDLKSPHLLYRTDFFPGLGWMLTKKLWKELSPKWPKSYWDDWIREPEQRKNRTCIRPEISRTRTFGKIGVSNGLFFEKHLQFIKLNEQYVPFTKMNLTYLLKKNYDTAFFNEVYKAELVTSADLKKGKLSSTAGPVRIPYYTSQSYKSTARMLGLMDDFKSGIPRTGYGGVVSFFYNGRRAYLAPSKRTPPQNSD